MAIKSILVHMAPDESRIVRLRVALALAIQHHAHLMIAYMTSPVSMPAASAGRAASAVYIADQTDIAHEKAEGVHDEIAEPCTRANVSWSWEVLEGDHNDLLAERSHYADVILVSQLHGASSEAGIGLHRPDDLLFMASCPVLVLPQAWTSETLGTRVLIAWKDTREAARAVRGGIGFMEKAEALFVLTCDPPHHRFEGGEELRDYLKRHGLAPEPVSDVLSNDVGEVILTYAEDLKADLLIMGAYGHSRWREFVLGGTTQHVLERMTIPVLMGH
jgi:nucleotide-binding universal stress UspA family protein